ncbi:HAD family hydrolase [bacterium]|nr:HAD family hydrolase [bacterium]
MPHPPRPPQAILFDLYGTLVPNFPPDEYRQATEDIARILGVSADDFQAKWGERFLTRVRGKDGGVAESIQAVLLELGVQVSPEALRRATERRLAFSRYLFDRSDETMPVLHSLRESGIPLALVSDCTFEAVECWDSHPLFAVFSARSLSCELGVMKPDPERYRQPLSKLKVEAEKCWYVGDGGSREFTGAREVGLFTICYCQPGSRDFVYDEDDSSADLKIAEFSELLALLQD